MRALAVGFTILAVLAALGRDAAAADPGLPAGPAVESLRLLNETRERAGLPPLVFDPTLGAVAAAHANDLVEHRFFAHISPRTGTPAARVRRAGVPFEAVGENLARHRTGAEAHALIMGSPPHRATLLSPRYSAVGVAAVTDASGWVTIVQVFVAPPAAPYAGEPDQHMLAGGAVGGRAAAGAAPTREVAAGAP